MQDDDLISIHAPTRGATYADSEKIKKAANFNPRSHAGSDKLEKHEREFVIFQSTLPRGERQNP